MKVLKFGGTSVGSVDSILSVKKIVEAIEEPVIVVVSALGGITDKLLKTASMATNGDVAYEREFSEIVARHLAQPHGRRDARQMQRIVDVPQQAAHAHVCRRVPQSGQRCQERLYVLAAVRQQSVIEVSLPVTAADLRQTVRRKAEHRGAQGGNEGHVLPGVVHDLQNGQGQHLWRRRGLCQADPHRP